MVSLCRGKNRENPGICGNEIATRQFSAVFCSFAAMKNTLVANGRRIAWYHSGPSEDALPLVLLHGFCEDASVWAPVIPQLKGMRVARIDLPGFGGSDAPLVPGMDTYADAVCAVLNELNVGRCVLAGHSMGGYAALAFARDHPERLAGLGLVHAHPYEDSPERIENRRRGIGMLQSGKKDLYVAQLFPGLFAPAFAQANPGVVDALVEQGRRNPDAGIIAALEGMILRDNHLDTLRTCPCPVLFMLGDQDTIAPLDLVLSAAILPRIADIQVLRGVGHMGMFEAPDETAEGLMKFAGYVESLIC